VLPIGKQEVPRMRVGVVDTIPKYHLQVHVRDAPHQVVDVPTRGLDTVSPGDFVSSDQRHGEHVGPAPVRVRRRYDDVRLVGEVSGELLQVRQFLPQIDRRPHHRVEFSHHDARRVGGQGFIVALNVAGQCAHQLEIVEHPRTGTGMDHLHHHRGAVR
jgi:hypothetical protein